MFLSKSYTMSFSFFQNMVKRKKMVLLKKGVVYTLRSVLFLQCFPKYMYTLYLVQTSREKYNSNQLKLLYLIFLDCL